MNVTGLDGKEYSLNLSKYRTQRESCSSGHKKARLLLKEIYPCYQILEEVKLPGSARFSLKADFYIPGLCLMVEVNGQQHYQYNSFHYETQHDFLSATNRDRKKAEWCQINNIRLVILNDADSTDDWRRLLQGEDEEIRGDTG